MLWSQIGPQTLVVVVVEYCGMKCLDDSLLALHLSSCPCPRITVWPVLVQSAGKRVDSPMLLLCPVLIPTTDAVLVMDVLERTTIRSPGPSHFW